jgi:hypothetical protein
MVEPVQSFLDRITGLTSLEQMAQAKVTSCKGDTWNPGSSKSSGFGFLSRNILQNDFLKIQKRIIRRLEALCGMLTPDLLAQNERLLVCTCIVFELSFFLFPKHFVSSYSIP